jgi:hypothetical protein
MFLMNRTTKLIVGCAACLALLVVSLVSAGCAQSASTKWAQNSPMIHGVNGNATSINLGARGE